MRPSVRVPALPTCATRVFAAILSATTLALTGATTFAQDTQATNGVADASTSSSGQRLEQLKSFLHEIMIAKPDVAASQAQAMIDGGLTATELATLVDENDLADKFDRAMTRARGMMGLEELAPRIEQMLREGRLELARDPKRIEQSIQMLTGTLREQMFARERLDAAGEYAMPALLKVVVTGGDASREVAATRAIEDLKRFAVMPLCTALPELDPGSQRKVCDMLGEIGYPTAIPFLVEVARAEDTSGEVRAAAGRALSRLNAKSDDPSAQFAELARRYFDGEESLTPYPTEATNNVWSYDPFGGLGITPVPTPIFADVMSMMMARKALDFDATNGNALAIFVASDLRRENQLPDGVTDPIFGDFAYSPSFFAMAAGPSVDQAVLAMAIDRKDTALVRDAIAAMSQTSGAKSLVGQPTGSRQALLECLRYPERRVRYDAALAIGKSLPEETFPGDFSVVPTLATAVRDAGTTIAGVVALNEEDRRQLSGRLSMLGFTTLTGASNYFEFEPEIVSSPGLDLLVVAGTPESIKQAVDSVRVSAVAGAVPVVAVVPETELAPAMRAVESDSGVVVWPANGDDETFASAVDLAFAAQSGGQMTEEEALDYTVQSLETLKKIAISRSPVFSIRDAEQPLLQALEARSGGVRLLVADVLALVPSPEAQRKLTDAALASEDENERIDLLGRAADSARRFGNQLEQRHVDALRALIADSSGNLAEAAGRLYGALDLSTSETVKLIVKD